MRLGILAYASPTGLGYQTRDYFRHLNPEKVMLVDLSRLNGMTQDYNWYQNAELVHGYPSDEQIDMFLRDIDVMLFAETPLNYYFYTRARQLGIKTAVVLNWEFFDHIVYPEKPLPDLFIMPSVWYWDDAKAFANSHNVKILQIHHPVDRDVFEFKVRDSKHFFHIAGKPAAYDRNGTWDYLNVDPTGRVVVQSKDMLKHVNWRYRNAKIKSNIQEPNQIYTFGDILVFPRRYGGNCLPLNEALSSGCPVIMPDISPNNHLLPKEWLVKATVSDSFTPRTKIDIYSVDRGDLEEKLNWFRNCDIQEESRKANEIADKISWKTLKPHYIKALESLL